ncbi:hypothetical protein [Dactylosporangium sp. NPDC049140]|uniref:hypothetical protein n=1 Tax=Dactylosporangium sp. NPDC049140 TaxID=3155647 RepID=UPI0033F44EFB
MRSSRRLLLAVVLSGALTVTTACTSKKDDKAGGGAAPGSTSAAAATAAARTDLANAFNKLGGAPYGYTATTQTGSTGTIKLVGSSNPPKKTSTGKTTVINGERQINAEVIVVGTDVYLKVSEELPNVDPDKWMRIDATKTSLGKLGLGSPDDPANVKGFTDAIVTAEKTGPGAYKGTIDATKRPLPASAAALVQQMGDAAKSVAFEATVGNDGYPTMLKVSMPAVGRTIPPTTNTSTFKDFGKAVTISKPANAKVIQAPASLLSQYA